MLCQDENFTVKQDRIAIATLDRHNSSIVNSIIGNPQNVFVAATLPSRSYSNYALRSNGRKPNPASSAYRGTDAKNWKRIGMDDYSA